METEIIFEPDLKDLKAPGSILIEGLPGVGLVAKGTVAYLLKKLGGRRICRFYSPYFPTAGYVRDGRLIPSFADLYYVEKPKPLLLLYGNSQPSSYYGQHEFCDKVLRVSLEIGANFILTLGGYGKEEISEERKVYISSTKPEMIRSALKRVDAEVYDGQIIGAAGLLITLAGDLGVDNLSLLVEAGRAVPDFYSIRRALDSVNKLLDLGLEIGDTYSISRAYVDMVRRLES